MDDENKELKNYTRLFNPILEALYKSDLSGAEFQIVLCVIRATYGWKQKKHPMSTSLIASRTGLNERTVRRLVKLLIEKNYLINFGLDKSKKCNVLGLNKKYSQWNCVMGSNDPGGEMTPGENCNQRGVKSVDSRGVKIAEVGGQMTREYRKLSKDTVSKENISKEMCLKNHLFLSSTGIPYTEIDEEEGFGYWHDKDGAARMEPLTEGRIKDG